MLGYVSDAALAELYRRCAVFCYPSLGEGFGLPVLEAMAAGAPVLTSNLSSLPEVGGERSRVRRPAATWRASPPACGACSATSPADAARLGEGLERASEFSWERFAQITLNTLDHALIR